MSLNQRRLAQEDAIAIASQRRFQAVVVAKSGGLVQIRRLDATVADPTFYPAREGLAATVVAGDLVMCDAVGGTVIVDYKYVVT